MKYPCPCFPYKLPKAEIAEMLKGIERPLIVEIGANDGEDSLELFGVIPNVAMHCFEPDPRPLARFFPGLIPHVGLYPFAVGSYDGKAILHMSGGDIPHAHVRDWDLSSSIRKPTGHLIHSPEINFDRQCEVDVIRLDTWFAMLPKYGCQAVDFIWMDAQGSEGDVIRGGKETLKRTRWIYSEFYDDERYEGQPNLPQIMEMLGSNWKLKGVYEGYNFLAKNMEMND